MKKIFPELLIITFLIIVGAYATESQDWKSKAAHFSLTAYVCLVSVLVVMMIAYGIFKFTKDAIRDRREEREDLRDLKK
jgi:peptidoglycan/LPS O-acetylase OafA/YrhL